MGAGRGRANRQQKRAEQEIEQRVTTTRTQNIASRAPGHDDRDDTDGGRRDPGSRRAARHGLPGRRPPPAVRSKIRRRDASDGGQAREISDSQGDRPWEQIEGRHVPEGGYPHGKPASWVLVAVVTAAAVTGGISIITHAWVLLWACIAIAVLAIPAGKMIGIMEDTVNWGSTPAAASDPQPSGPETDRGRDQSAQIR